MSERAPKNAGSLLSTLIIGALFYAAAMVCAHYLQWGMPVITQTALFVLSYICFLFINRNRAAYPTKPSSIAILALFALGLSAAVVIGRHITVVDRNYYAGLASDCYLSPFHVFDVAALCSISCITFILILAAHIKLQSAITAATHTGDQSKPKKIGFRPISPELLVISWLFIFLMWLPYLLAYWPGFVFGDTLSSIHQAVGLAPLVNHHPVCYTLFIQACLNIASALGFGRTVGVALSTVIQMVFLSGCFAYTVAWLRARFRISKLLFTSCAVFYALSPTIAAISIAMWKDPMFSGAFLVLGLLLADIYISKGACIKRPSYLFRLFFFPLIAMLMRNNGLYVVLFILLILAGTWLLGKKKTPAASGLHLTSARLVVAIAAYALITGPGYAALKVTPTPKVEGLGIPLNQMARVAALSGSMTESDEEYMDSILPIKQYSTTYRPCCTDLLKWDPNFNSAPLEHDFWKHWLSMLVRNPKLYIESWILQTYGFWTINAEPIFDFGNIDGGVPRNFSYTEQASNLDIHPQNLLKIEAVKDLLAYNMTPIPVGWLFWAFLFMSLELLMSNAKSLALLYAPAIGVVGTLVIASPINYWPRYGAVTEFMLPVFICMIVVLTSSATATRQATELSG